MLRDFQYLMGHDCQIDEDEAYNMNLEMMHYVIYEANFKTI